MNWTTEHELVGERVVVETGYGDIEDATVIGVPTNPDVSLIRVRTDAGDVLVGNQWDHA